MQAWQFSQRIKRYLSVILYISQSCGMKPFPRTHHFVPSDSDSSWFLQVNFYPFYSRDWSHEAPPPRIPNELSTWHSLCHYISLRAPCLLPWIIYEGGPPYLPQHTTALTTFPAIIFLIISLIALSWTHYHQRIRLICPRTMVVSFDITASLFKALIIFWWGSTTVLHSIQR